VGAFDEAAHRSVHDYFPALQPCGDFHAITFSASGTHQAERQLALGIDHPNAFQLAVPLQCGDRNQDTATSLARPEHCHSLPRSQSARGHSQEDTTIEGLGPRGRGAFFHPRPTLLASVLKSDFRAERQ
jgi:hypothetical protein